ncbi:hypothetical protein Tsubulata_019946 [Turnera subulata]|uniref:NPH3 domain-containing protein n=1 Tax=Turnera subulata TaxID=218843 RepID=A0A9Q0GMJ0_9ROSI|nr:hypothetical protein Tsubulata_019946 [Turnera subulata]
MASVCCDLEVDVNGEETFMVEKRIMTLYSGRLSRLFGKSTSSTGNFKVIFNDFPGGAESFELMLRFCYNNGGIEITPYNISLLYSAAQFMEMNKSISGVHNLMERIDKSLQDGNYWTWSEILVIIKQCQDILPLENCSGIIEKCMDSLIGRIAMPGEPSPCASTSSPESSGFRFSFDTRSTESLKNSFSRANWWFDDLLVLSTALVEKMINSMVSRKLDHAIISKFLFYYQKSKFQSAKSDEKCKIVETVIDMLYILDWNSVSFKSLFGILRISLNLEISKSSRNKLEIMIGSQMDQSTLDNLLIPSPQGTNYLYNVNLILRLLKAFLCEGICQISTPRLRKVARLMDLYIAEVAPDPCLRTSKFLALAMALPDSARDSYDGLYRAMDMYLEVQVHSGLSEEERVKICCALNYEKLSAEVCIHLSENKKFPSRSAVQALMSQKIKLKSLLRFANDTKVYGDSPSPCSLSGKGQKNEASDQIVLYAGKLDLSPDKEELKAHLQGMQWRVIELEKVCMKMQNQMTKILKSRVPSHSNARSLPRLCS